MTGKELKKIRLSIGMTQQEFGEELGFKNPQVQISQFENGKRQISRRLEVTIKMWEELMESYGGTE